jgi:uncharacterized protein DUF3108
LRQFGTIIAWAAFCAAAVCPAILLTARGLAPSAPQASPGASLFGGGETLRFKLLWPSGVGLGEAVLTVSAGQSQLHLDMTVDADLPIQNISGKFSSVATPDGLCSIQYHRKMTEGSKVSEESIEFDQKAHQAKRTVNGQTTALSVSECARDPLAFLYYFRSELAQRRTAQTTSLVLAPEKRLEISSGATETITAGGRQRKAEKFSAVIRYPYSSKSFDVWFSTDGHWEPVLVRLPSPLAVFSAEIE